MGHWLHYLSSRYKKFFFYTENNYSLEQPPQGRDRVHFTGGFQDAIGQGDRCSHLSSLSHDRLDQMISWGPFQSGIYYNSMILCVSVGSVEMHTISINARKSMEEKRETRFCRKLFHDSYGLCVRIFHSVVLHSLFVFETNSVFLSGLFLSDNNVHLKKDKVWSHNSSLENNVLASKMISVPSSLFLCGFVFKFRIR